MSRNIYIYEKKRKKRFTEYFMYVEIDTTLNYSSSVIRVISSVIDERNTFFFFFFAWTYNARDIYQTLRVAGVLMFKRDGYLWLFIGDPNCTLGYLSIRSALGIEHVCRFRLCSNLVDGLDFVAERKASLNFPGF